MARRPRKDDPQAQRIHEEMLQHLAQNPPPKPKARPKPAPAKPKPAPAPRPQLMLRRLRLVTAIDRLERFVAHHQKKSTPEILVIVGKGRSSGDDGPVLRPAVEEWCRRHPEAVVAVAPAPRAAGGDGALLVRLRPSG